MPKRMAQAPAQWLSELKDAKAAHERAIRLGAPTNVEVEKGTGELNIPAIEGIGG